MQNLELLKKDPMHRKRISKKRQSLIQGFLFFLFTIGTVCCLIIYLWVYTEIDETTLTIEIQNTTLKEFENQLSMNYLGQHLLIH